MACLDVSEILDDLDLCDQCKVIHRVTETVNGRKLARGIEHQIIAVIQPASPVDIQQLATQVGSGFVGETLSIWTRERLSVGSDGSLGDLIDFKGQRYSVASVEDYFANGRYFRALATGFGDV